MWQRIVKYILRKREINLIVIGIITIIMGYFATTVKMSYEMARMLPETDPTYVDHQAFKKQFGEDGSTMFVGVCDENLFRLDNFCKWQQLTENINNIDGINRVLSISQSFDLVKNEQKGIFELTPILDKRPSSQASLDSSLEILFSLPFYDGFLYNENTKATLAMIVFDNKKINSKERDAVCHKIGELCQAFSAETGVETHLSGLPYIRTITSEKIKSELYFFLVLAIIIAALVLYFFFKSLKSVVFPIIIVLITVVWAMGLIGLIGYQITILTAMIPPLLIVIGVENSIFITNKYHYEYRKHGNKALAISRAISRIGKANILTNATTAIGFFAFIITRNSLLIEFGIVASISIILSYALTLILMPTFFSYLKPPTIGETRHLENIYVAKLLAFIEKFVISKRKIIYLATLLIVALSVAGILKIKISGRMVDDIPHKDKLYEDLVFFEDNFNGIMPLEISIDTKKDKGVYRLQVLEKIDELQEILAEYPEFAKPLSIVEVFKFAKQAYYNGNPDFYQLPYTNELAFMMNYLPKINKDSSQASNIMRILVDSNFRKTRISVQMKNIGTNEIEELQNELKPQIDEIFPPEKYDVVMTGTSIVFLKGTNFLTTNLLESLVLALICIGLILFSLFRSTRILALALVTNIIPLLFTAGMMGYMGIPIKISSILVFSIALGISVDNTIQFLSRLRLELRINKNDMKKATVFALGETGFSMIYSSIILFFGFSIFFFSTFGGTQIVGILVALTLLVALVSNLFLLPALLMWFDKWQTNKNLKN